MYMCVCVYIYIYIHTHTFTVCLCSEDCRIAITIAIKRKPVLSNFMTSSVKHVLSVSQWK